MLLSLPRPSCESLHVLSWAIICWEERRRNRALLFFNFLLCVLIMRQNYYCNDDGHFVHPTATSNTADDHAGPSTAAKDSDSRGGWRLFTLVERPVLSLSSSYSASLFPALITIKISSFTPATSSAREKGAPLKELCATTWTIDPQGKLFFLDPSQYPHVGCRATVDDCGDIPFCVVVL